MPLGSPHPLTLYLTLPCGPPSEKPDAEALLSRPSRHSLTRVINLMGSGVQRWLGSELAPSATCEREAVDLRSLGLSSREPPKTLSEALRCVPSAANTHRKKKA